MNLTELRLNTYVPAARAQFAVPISIDRRQFLLRTVSFAMRGSSNADLITESAMLLRDAGSPQNGMLEYVPSDDLTPVEKAARRLMMVASCAKDSNHTEFTEEEIIALAFDAGCELTVFEGSDGAEFLPIKMIRVERRTDGLIVVYEEGVSDGVILGYELTST